MTVVLTAGASTATVDPAAGGRLVSLVAGAEERLIEKQQSGFPPPLDPALTFGNPLMAPFVGRLAGGHVAWAGREVAIPRNYGEHAIHGTVYNAPWEVAAQSGSAVDLRLKLDRQRWPFEATMTQRYTLAADRIEIEATLAAGEPQPAAIGWHPWFRRTGEMRLKVESDNVLVLDEELLPTGALAPVSGQKDLRSGPAVGDRALDDVYADVASPAILTWPDLELRIAFEPPVRSVVVFTKPHTLCVEPMTAWPDAIRLERAGKRETGLVGLATGERLIARTTWSWRPIER